MAKTDMKRPNGWLVEEYLTETDHLFEDGQLRWHASDSSIGEYTGRFWFEYLSGESTKIYTQRTAPKWLLALYREAIGTHE